MNDRNDQATERLQQLVAGLSTEVRAALMAHSASGEFRQLAFSAARLQWTDDVGSNALSLAVYNPNNFKIFVGLAGGDATPQSFPVPKQKLIVIPCLVNGSVKFAVEAGEVGEGGSIWRVRFPTPQSFYIGALA
jgi:hypothetical protein